MQLRDIKITPLLDTLELLKIDDSVYFSAQYKQYISNSRLGLLNPRQDGSPEKFFEGGFGGFGNASLQIGSAVHSQVLQPDLFELAPDVGKPTAKLGAVSDELYPIFLEREVTSKDVIAASDKIDYYKGKMTAEKVKNVIDSSLMYWKARQKHEFNLSSTKEVLYLDKKSLEISKACIESLQKNKKAMDLLHPTGLLEDPISENEQAILLDVQVECPNGANFILHLKSKLDNFTIDKDTNTIIVNDVKTLGRILSEFSSNVSRFCYSREIAMYLYLLKLVAEKFYGVKEPKMQANYLVVSTIPNFYSKVQPVTYKEIRQGFHEFSTLLRYAAYQIGYKGFSLENKFAYAFT